jgi:C4-dicarboxylate-specific signal transduction histidine kinase
MEHAIRSVRGQADPRIEIGWLESRAGDPVIFIRHNGVGMDRAEQEGSADLLEPSVSDTYGLALAPSLARQVVEDLAGRLWAHSSGPSQGVTFLLTVPQEPPCEEGQATVADRQCALQSR